MPFFEEGADGTAGLDLGCAGSLDCSANPSMLAKCRVLVLIVGTPVDEHLNPSFEAIPGGSRAVPAYLRDEQVLVLRSTVSPGTSAKVRAMAPRPGLEDVP